MKILACSKVSDRCPLGYLFFNFPNIVKYLFVHCTIPSIIGSQPPYPTSPSTPYIAFTSTLTPHQPDPHLTPLPTPTDFFFENFLKNFNYSFTSPLTPPPPTLPPIFFGIFTKTSILRLHPPYTPHPTRPPPRTDPPPPDFFLNFHKNFTSLLHLP